MALAALQRQRSTADLVGARLLASWVLLFMVSGCAGDGHQQAYIGWQCSGQKNSDNWRCEQREIRNGVAAGVVASSADQKLGDAAPNNTERAKAEPDIATRAATMVVFENGVRPKNWREQLPGLSAAETSEATAAPAPKSRAASERDKRVTPEPEPAYANWADQANEKSVGNPVKDGAQDSAGQDNSARTPSTVELAPVLSSTDVTSAPPAASRARRSYTVQLGAFGNATQLTEFVEQHNLAGLAYRQGVATAVSGRALRVLLWGQFDTATEATAAWQREARNYPAVNDYWVRPLAAVRELSD